MQGAIKREFCKVEKDPRFGGSQQDNLGLNPKEDGYSCLMSTDSLPSSKRRPKYIHTSPDGMEILMTTPGEIGNIIREDLLTIKVQKKCTSSSCLVLPLSTKRNQVAGWPGQRGFHHKWPRAEGTLRPCGMAWGKLLLSTQHHQQKPVEAPQHHGKQADKNSISQEYAMGKKISSTNDVGKMRQLHEKV